MSDGISEDEWRAEIDRAVAESPAHRKNPWTNAERDIALYRPGEITSRARLAILNEANKAAGRDPRSLSALINFIEKTRNEPQNRKETNHD